jgi:hypothetical protein
MSGFIQLESGPEHAGSFALSSNGDFTYIANQDYFGQDQFTYRWSQNGQLSDPIPVHIEVTPVNDLPVVVSQPQSLFSVSRPEQVWTDLNTLFYDAEGGQLTYELSTPTNPAAFSVLQLSGHHLVMEHETAVIGSSSFTVYATDTDGGVAQLDVDIRIERIFQPLSVSLQDGGSSIDGLSSMTTETADSDVFTRRATGGGGDAYRFGMRNAMHRLGQEEPDEMEQLVDGDLPVDIVSLLTAVAMPFPLAKNGYLESHGMP